SHELCARPPERATRMRAAIASAPDVRAAAHELRPNDPRSTIISHARQSVRVRARGQADRDGLGLAPRAPNPQPPATTSARRAQVRNRRIDRGEGGATAGPAPPNARADEER